MVPDGALVILAAAVMMGTGGARRGTMQTPSAITFSTRAKAASGMGTARIALSQLDW